MLRRAFVTPADFLFAADVPRVLEISTAVAPDGSGAAFNLLLTTGGVAFGVDHGDLAKMVNTFRAASSQVAARKRYAHDWGRGWLSDLCETAPRPAETTVRIDPRTGDLLILNQFDDQAPIAFRRPMEEAHRIMESVRRIARETAQ